jgi:FkbM family methyltransferase
VGEWSAAVLSVSNPDRLLAVEPDPRPLPALRRRLGTKASIVEAAVGSSEREIHFNLCAHTHGSSALQPRSEMNEYYGFGYTVDDTIPIRQVTLDSLTVGWTRVDILKIDVQGYELEVLRGAENTLKITEWLLVEANFRSHYDGDSLFPQLHEAIAQLNFRLAGISPPFSIHGEVMWCDVLYRSSLAERVAPR